jgi:two-component system LytT family sensor kinase
MEAMFLLLVTYFTGFWVSVALRYYYIKIDFRNLTIPWLITTLIIGSIASAFIWYWADSLLSITFRPSSYSRMQLQHYFSFAWSNSFVVILWSALYVSFNFWFDYREQETKLKQANELAHTAQLQMLRYQLNPHFLFNSLNSIRALVEEDKIRAKSMITELSEFLRYSLVSRNFSNVPLSNELEAMEHYFAIEKTRYEEKLQVNFNIDPAANDFPVLSFLIHPIIENAIKYGMQTSELPLTITIDAKIMNDKLRLAISNTGKWVEPETTSSGTGTGLDNVKQRLENAFPNKHSFNTKFENNLVTVEIEIEK